jgi:NADH-quinone oxidoreductase subunit D
LQPDVTTVNNALSRSGIEAAIEEVAGVGVVCRVAPTDARKAVAALRDSELAFDFPVDIFGIDTGEAIDVVYRLRSLTRDEEITVKSAHEYGSAVRSVWDLFPSALLVEREMAEMFGLTLAGHPNPRRLLSTDGCPPFLKKTTEIRGPEEVRHRDTQIVDLADLDRTAGSIAAPNDVFVAPSELPPGIVRIPHAVAVEAAEHLMLNMGPQHPSTHGVLRLILELDGETVVAGEASIGYLHRGKEKLAESRRFNAVGTLLDRCDYVAGIHSELAFALATEKIAGIEVPDRANWLRVLLGELNRIGSHIVWYGPFGLDTGAMGPFLYTFRDREYLLDILENITGARMMFNYVRPGGVVRDITPEADGMIREWLKHFEVHLEENAEMLMDNELFQARTQGIGVFSREAAIGFGLTGANLRASGVPWDVRRDRPYAAYDQMEFDVPVAEAGDVYARAQVRLEEMRQSARIIRQCLDGMPEGDFTAKVAKVLRPAAGEAYAAVESPRGELGIHLVTDGGDSPYRMRYRPPTLYALNAGESMLHDVLIADAVVVMGSVDLILGEVDR